MIDENDNYFLFLSVTSKLEKILGIKESGKTDSKIDKS